MQEPLFFLNPSERRLHDPYFIVAHCMAMIPSKNKTEIMSEGDNSEKPLDEKLRSDIEERFKQHPGYEGIIEVFDDRNQAETKATTFHESLHYLILRYQTETGRNFVDTFVINGVSQLERYQAEYLIHERVVGILTDKLLVHDQDALFESRWPAYSLSNSKSRFWANTPSSFLNGLILGFSVANPYLLPLALVPGRVRDFALEKYKQSKKEELTKPAEYPEFKI